MDSNGNFRILDSGVARTKRYIVVEDNPKDLRGPVMKAGPFDSIADARAALHELAVARDEAADDEEHKRRRQDHRSDDGDVHDGRAKPSPRKAAGCRYH
ncbi:MAG TPA: hypothetical protein VKY24_24000 [Reyranella sp.]|nr:hypothetical protein [Reyranella sp.]